MLKTAHTIEDAVSSELNSSQTTVLNNVCDAKEDPIESDQKKLSFEKQLNQYKKNALNISAELLQTGQKEKVSTISCSNLPTTTTPSNNQAIMYKNRVRQLEDRLREKNRLLLEKQDELINFGKCYLNTNNIVKIHSSYETMSVQCQTLPEQKVFSLYSDNGAFTQLSQKQAEVGQKRSVHTQIQILELETTLEATQKKNKKVEDLLSKRTEQFNENRKGYEKKIKQFKHEIQLLNQHSYILSQQNIELRENVACLEQQLIVFVNKQNSPSKESQANENAGKDQIEAFSVDEQINESNVINQNNETQKLEGRLEEQVFDKKSQKMKCSFHDKSQLIFKKVSQFLKKQFIHKKLNPTLAAIVQDLEFNKIQQLEFTKLELGGISKQIENIWLRTDEFAGKQQVQLQRTVMETIQYMFELAKIRIKQFIKNHMSRTTVTTSFNDQTSCLTTLLNSEPQAAIATLKIENLQNLQKPFQKSQKQQKPQKRQSATVKQSILKQTQQRKQRLQAYEQIEKNRQKSNKIKKVHFQQNSQIQMKNEKLSQSNSINNIIGTTEKENLLRKYNIYQSQKKENYSQAPAFNQLMIQQNQDFIDESIIPEFSKKNIKSKKPSIQTTKSNRKYSQILKAHESQQRLYHRSMSCSNLPSKTFIGKNRLQSINNCTAPTIWTDNGQSDNSMYSSHKNIQRSSCKSIRNGESSLKDNKQNIQNSAKGKYQEELSLKELIAEKCKKLTIK